MKRFVFWFVMGLLAVGWMTTHHRHERAAHRRLARAHLAFGSARPTPDTGHDGWKGVAFDRAARADEFVAYRRDDEDENDGDDDPVLAPAEGLPVPVVPGTRVTEAKAEPPAPPAAPRPPRARRPAKPPIPPRPARVGDVQTVTGRRSATEQRAVDDAVVQLRRELTDRLRPNVPTDWRAPDRLIDEIVRSAAVQVTPIKRDYGTVYEATIKVDRWSQKLAKVEQAYRHEQVMKRLLVLAGLLAFVLVCLAAVSGYIKADEATKGYYTTRLRLAAAAGVGAAGALLYRMLHA